MINIRSDFQKPREGRDGCLSSKRRIFHLRPPSKIVKRISEPLWIQRGWQRRDDEYRGFYRTPYGSYQGKIVYRYIGKIQFYIFNPPSCIIGHPHESCFFPKDGGKYEVHFKNKSKTIDDGILAIEQILIDAFERKISKTV
jgi:hypothetical protein